MTLWSLLRNVIKINYTDCVVLISEEDDVDDEEQEQNFQPTAKVGAKKQKKLEEKQAKKAQREVSRGESAITLSAFLP